MQSRFNGKCAKCSGPIKAGDEIHYDGEARKAYHPDCKPGGAIFEGTEAERLAESLGYRKV